MFEFCVAATRKHRETQRSGSRSVWGSVIRVFLLVQFVCVDVPAADWPQWRGPNRDNVSSETGLQDSWPAQGPPLNYRIDGLGSGITPPAIVGERAFTITEFDGYEYVLAFNADTGQRLWLTPIGIQSNDFVNYHVLMRWLSQRTPTVHDGKLYAVTAFGLLVCLATEDGQPLWSKDFRQEYDVSRQSWGYCDYPLVDGDLLICVPGGTQATIVALNRHTGQEIWRCLLTTSSLRNVRERIQRSGYAATLHGQLGSLAFYVVTTNEAVHFLSKSDGKPLAKYDRIYHATANSHTPLFDRGDIVATNGYAGGMARLGISSSLQAFKLTEKYHNTVRLDAFQDIGLIARGRMFHAQNGQVLICLDPNSGETLFARRMGSRFAHSYADGHLYCVSVDGLVSLIDVDSANLETQSSFQLPEIQPARGVSLPVIANGRLYLRFDNQLFCYDVSASAVNGLAGSQVVQHLPPKLDPSLGDRRLPVPIYLPTPSDVVTRMLQEVDLKPGQNLVDLGSGDGRIVIEAAKSFGAHAVGYEIDDELVALSRAAIVKEQLTATARIETVDMYAADLSSVDVLAIYLYPVVMDELKKQITRMPDGSRIVSHQFQFPGIEPEKQLTMQSEESGEKHAIFLYRLPLKETVR